MRHPTLGRNGRRTRPPRRICPQHCRVPSTIALRRSIVAEPGFCFQSMTRPTGSLRPGSHSATRRQSAEALTAACSGSGRSQVVLALVARVLGDTQGVRIDLTFVGDYELAVPDSSDLSEMLAYQYPPGAVVDLATIAVAERTISYQVAGMASTDPVPIASPDPVQVEVRAGAANRWLGVFDAQLTSPRGVNCAVALPDRESIAVVSHGAAYRVWAADPRRWDEVSIGGVMTPAVVTAPELVLLVEHTTILSPTARTASRGTPNHPSQTTSKPFPSTANTYARRGMTRPGTRLSCSRSISGLDAPSRRRCTTDEGAAAIDPPDQKREPRLRATPLLERYPRSRAVAANSWPRGRQTGSLARPTRRRG